MNYYECLDVPKDADAATIKKAYRRQSKKHHPDRDGGDARVMVWINKAYETLSDPEKRAYYDACGQDKPYTPVETLARHLLFQWGILCATEMPENMNLVAGIRAQAQSYMSQLSEELSKIEMQEKRIKKHIENLKCDDKENELSRVIGEHCQKITQKVNETRNRKQGVVLALEMLKKYRSGVIDMVTLPMSGFQGFTFTSNG